MVRCIGLIEFDWILEWHTSVGVYSTWYYPQGDPPMDEEVENFFFIEKNKVFMGRHVTAVTSKP